MDFVDTKPTICCKPEPQRLLQAKTKCENDVRFIHVNHKVARACAKVCIFLTVIGMLAQVLYLHQFHIGETQGDDDGFYFLSSLQKLLQYLQLGTYTNLAHYTSAIS